MQENVQQNYNFRYHIKDYDEIMINLHVEKLGSQKQY